MSATKYTDSDLLNDMISCLDYHTFVYGNDGPWYAQGEYHDINIDYGNLLIDPYGSTNLVEYENNKPKGFWKYYV